MAEQRRAMSLEAAHVDPDFDQNYTSHTIEECPPLPLAKSGGEPIDLDALELRLVSSLKKCLPNPLPSKYDYDILINLIFFDLFDDHGDETSSPSLGTSSAYRDISVLVWTAFMLSNEIPTEKTVKVIVQMFRSTMAVFTGSPSAKPEEGILGRSSRAIGAYYEEMFFAEVAHSSVMSRFRRIQYCREGNRDPLILFLDNFEPTTEVNCADFILCCVTNYSLFGIRVFAYVDVNFDHMGHIWLQSHPTDEDIRLLPHVHFLDVCSPDKWIPYSDWLTLGGHTESGLRSHQITSRGIALYYIAFHMKWILATSMQRHAPSRHAKSTEVHEEITRALSCLEKVHRRISSGLILLTSSDHFDFLIAIFYFLSILAPHNGKKRSEWQLIEKWLQLTSDLVGGLDQWDALRPSFGLCFGRKFNEILFDFEENPEQIDEMKLRLALKSCRDFHSQFGGYNAYTSLALTLAKLIDDSPDRLCRFGSDIEAIYFMWLREASSHGRVKCKDLFIIAGKLPSPFLLQMTSSLCRINTLVEI